MDAEKSKDNLSVKIEINDDLLPCMNMLPTESHLFGQKQTTDARSFPVALIASGETESRSTENTLGQIVEVEASSDTDTNECKANNVEQNLVVPSDPQIDECIVNSLGRTVCKKEYVPKNEKSDTDIKPDVAIPNCPNPVEEMSMLMEVFEEGVTVSKHQPVKLIEPTYVSVVDKLVEKQKKSRGIITGGGRTVDNLSNADSPLAEKPKNTRTGSKRSLKRVEQEDISVSDTNQSKKNMNLGIEVKRVRNAKANTKEESRVNIKSLNPAAPSCGVKAGRMCKKMLNVNLSITESEDLIVSYNDKTYFNNKHTGVQCEGKDQGKKSKDKVKNKAIKQTEDGCEGKPKEVDQCYSFKEGVATKAKRGKRGGGTRKLSSKQRMSKGKEGEKKKSGNSTPDDHDVLKADNNKPGEAGGNGSNTIGNNKSKSVKTVACEYCEDVFLTREKLWKHWTTAHSDLNPFKCTACYKGFPTRQEMRQHKYDKNSTDHVFSCQYCQKFFKKKSKLIQHERKHTGEKPYICEECGKAFRIRNLLNRHLANHLPDDQLGTYSCGVCGKIFRAAFKLQRHVATHKDGQSKPCEICGKTFASSTSLYWHLKTHSDTHKHQCPHCEAQFIRSDRLQIHLQNKKNLAKLTCKYCNYVSLCKGTIHTHLDTHVEYRKNKKFACSHCDQRFYNKGTLVRHGVTHLDRKEYPFCCSYCSGRFSRIDSLRDHLKVAHNDTDLIAPRGLEIGMLKDALQSKQITVMKQSTGIDTMKPWPLKEMTGFPDLKKHVDNSTGVNRQNTNIDTMEPQSLEEINVFPDVKMAATNEERVKRLSTDINTLETKLPEEITVLKINVSDCGGIGQTSNIN